MKPVASVAKGTPRGSAILVPGYRGTARQPLLVALARQCEAIGLAAVPVEVMKGAAGPSRGYATEIAALRTARDEVSRAVPGPVALVGRSFGGRICAFVAEEEPPDALAIVGHPISPPGRPRPRDEDALRGIRCPTLIVQGDADELGPLAVLQLVAASNPLIDLVVITGAGHDLGAHEREAVEHVIRWLDARLREDPAGPA